MQPRVVAVDWTGAREPVKNLWLAEAEPGLLLDVQRFRTRRELVEHLIAESQGSPELVVGLDFAFSLPSWFLEEHELDGPRELWEHMAQDADAWLEPRPPFWKLANAGRPAPDREFRRTDDDLRARGRRPSSVFKLVGPSQVGTGTLRGLPCLIALEAAGFNIWPFATGLPLVVEIYPAALGDLTRKSDPGEIARAVTEDERIPTELKAHAACSQDAFDAATSALRMAEHADEFERLETAEPGSRYAIEGRIWMPQLSAKLGHPKTC